MPPAPPRPPGQVGAQAPRHPAASHPGFDEDERPTGAQSAFGIQQVVTTVNAGFQRVMDAMALERELAAVRQELTKQEHSLEVERMQRMAAQERVEDRLKALEKDVEDTGQHRTKDIEAELDRMRSSQVHWVRYVIMAVVGGVATLLVAVLTRLLH